MSQGIERIDEVSALPPRQPEAHKGDFGRVLVVGGSRGMIGAPALAANAALRGGAGLVTVAAPETVQLAVAVLCPCATSVPLACDDDALAAEAVGQMARAAEGCDVLAVGPGLAVGIAQQNLVQAALAGDKPVVCDADGLNNLARLADWPARRRCPLVLTPHPGEFARLTGESIAHIQADREAAATAAACRWADARPDAAVVCVLKGAGTVVADGRRVYVNTTGNPGMATGGSGDVLTGLVAALIAQHLAPFEAACLAVYLHGRAGDLAAAELSEHATIAADLLDTLPLAISEHAGA